MPGDAYPKFRAAAVQVAPVFRDRDATIDKLETLVQKAVNVGADVTVFGESFIPAFPVWNLTYAPLETNTDFSADCSRTPFKILVRTPGGWARSPSATA